MNSSAWSNLDVNVVERGGEERSCEERCGGEERSCEERCLSDSDSIVKGLEDTILSRIHFKSIWKCV
jgi:hypothetical protein